jgi:chromosome segregation ATPase
MSFSKNALIVFQRSVDQYHVTDDVAQLINNPYEPDSIEAILYRKSWIDTVQWHFEDIIRDPEIAPEAALTLKRKIDKSNQERTDLVEQIDDYFLAEYHDVSTKAGATINTESPAWAIDRLSILVLKIYHMKEEANRPTAPVEHLTKCKQKLDILLEQKEDLSTAIDQLLANIESGTKYMKVYRQMKMYNDESLNPILYKK